MRVHRPELDGFQQETPFNEYHRCGFGRNSSLGLNPDQQRVSYIDLPSLNPCYEVTMVNNNGYPFQQNERLGTSVISVDSFAMSLYHCANCCDGNLLNIIYPSTR